MDLGLLQTEASIQNALPSTQHQPIHIVMLFKKFFHESKRENVQQ